MASMFYPLVLSCMVIGLVKRQVICRDGSVCWAILQAKHGLETPKHCHILAICKLAQIILLSLTCTFFLASVTLVVPLNTRTKHHHITRHFPLTLPCCHYLSFVSLSNQMAARKAMAGWWKETVFSIAAAAAAADASKRTIIPSFFFFFTPTRCAVLRHSSMWKGLAINKKYSFCQDYECLLFVFKNKKEIKS